MRVIVLDLETIPDPAVPYEPGRGDPDIVEVTDRMIITEHLLFAAHEGMVGTQRAAILMAGHCLPIACSQSSEQNEAGVHALWESVVGDTDTFFEALGIENVCPGMGDPDPLVSGLFVYTVEYDSIDLSADEDAEEAWEYLRGGVIRRPSGVELLRLSQGEAPWEGGVVL